jgi:sugar phosphate isomerase/epimerase
MSSSDSPDRHDRQTREQVNALQRAARGRGKVDFAAYLRFLAELPETDPAELRRRGVMRGEAFRL